MGVKKSLVPRVGVDDDLGRERIVGLADRHGTIRPWQHQARLFVGVHPLSSSTGHPGRPGADNGIVLDCSVLAPSSPAGPFLQNRLLERDSPQIVAKVKEHYGIDR